MNFAVLVFPGSNCDIDCFKAVEETIGQPVDYVWHTETDLSKYDCIIVPGGFSYGDYLRCGAIAQFAPVMDALKGCRSRQIHDRHLQWFSNFDGGRTFCQAHCCATNP